VFWYFGFERLLEYIAGYGSFSETFLILRFDEAVPLFPCVEEDSGSSQFMLYLRVGFLELR